MRTACASTHDLYKDWYSLSVVCISAKNCSCASLCSLSSYFSQYFPLEFRTDRLHVERFVSVHISSRCSIFLSSQLVVRTNIFVFTPSTRTSAEYWAITNFFPTLSAQTSSLWFARIFSEICGSGTIVTASELEIHMKVTIATRTHFMTSPWVPSVFKLLTGKVCVNVALYCLYLQCCISR